MTEGQLRYQKYKETYRAYWERNKDFLTAKSRIWKDKVRYAGKRKTVLERDDYKCVCCGMSNDEHRNLFGRDLTIHHIDGSGRNTWVKIGEEPEPNQNLDNLITLCSRCHQREERRERKRKGLFISTPKKSNREMFVLYKKGKKSTDKHVIQFGGYDTTGEKHFVNFYKCVLCGQQWKSNSIGIVREKTANEQCSKKYLRRI